MLNIKAILMALGGVIVVGGIGTYVVLENRKSQEAPIQASLPAATDQAVKDEPAASAADTNSGDTQSNDAATTASEEATSTETATETATSEPASPTADWVMPAFDLLRVEPDGSTVIAGRGEPNTTLKVMNGEEMIAETKIGSAGDFVVIFDEALNSGDYQLSLQVEDENGAALTSEETAIVSVPEDASGQLLAMVQKPGEASRIITQPEAAPVEETTTTAENTTEEKPAAATEVAESATTAAEEAVEKAAEVAANVEATATEAASAVESAVEGAVETATETAAETATKIAEAATEAKTAVEEKVAEVASNVTNEETVTAANTETSAAETAASKVADAAEKVMDKVTEGATEVAEKVQDKAEEVVETAKTAVETTTEKVAEETENTVAALVTENSDASDTQTDVQAATTGEQPQEEKMEAKTVGPIVEKPAVEEKPKAPTQNVRIEAVEVEGSKLFVAGSGTAGYQVRVFADDEEVGLANVESNGRFIVEATKDLTVGQHKITAALEDKQTNQVILRAIVPFNRPEGEALAAVASNDNTANDNTVSDSAANDSVTSENAVSENVTSEEKPAATTETETAMVKEETKPADALASTETETTTEVASSTETSSASTATETATASATETASASEETTTSDATPSADAGTTVADNQEPEKATEEVAAVATEEMVKSEETTTAASTEAEAPKVSETVVETATEDNTTATSETASTETETTTTVASANEAETTEPKTIVQDELQPASAQSVIIRRGDTLWQIARRTYGAGVRYTTIYLANQQQIENPDRISPGQIFEVPDEALENAEQLHRQRLGLE